MNRRFDDLTERIDGLANQVNGLAQRMDGFRSTMSDLSYNSRLTRRTDNIRWPRIAVNGQQQHFPNAPRTIQELNDSAPPEPRNPPRNPNGRQAARANLRPNPLNEIIQFYGIVIPQNATNAEKLREIKIFLGIDPDVGYDFSN